MKECELAEYCLDSLMRAGADKAQCSLGKTEMHEMNLDTGELSLLRTTFNNNLSVSIIKDQKKGSTRLNKTDRDSIRNSAAEVFELAEGAEPDPANDIAEKQEPEEFVAGSDKPDLERMHLRMKELIGQVKSSFPKIVLRQASLKFSHHDGCYINSNGVNFKTSRGIYTFNMMISSKDGEKTSSFNYTGFSAKELEKELLDYGSVRTLLEQSQEQTDTKLLEGKFTGEVIITPDCLESFIDYYIGTYLSGSVLISGTSIFKDKMNEAIADPRFTLHSKPVSEEIPDGYFITQDGYKAYDNTIIRNGVLRSFVIGLYASRKTGLKRSLNNGGCYVLDRGNKTFDEMVRSVKKGILLCRYSGGNPNANGDFSGIAKNSYYIENGEIQYPIRETMIAGNLAEMFRNIKDVSSKRINFGSALLPWLSVSGITVSGK